MRIGGNYMDTLLTVLSIICSFLFIGLAGYAFRFLQKGIMFFDYASQYILHDAEKENQANE